jgi:hypothetical protein
MPASLDDILTAQKNGVVSINSLNQTWLRAQGNVTSSTIAANTLITPNKCYLVNVSVVVAGSAVGKIYNTNVSGTGTATNLLATIPNTLGVYSLGLVCSSGIYIEPGTGQSLNVTYTPTTG